MRLGFVYILDAFEREIESILSAVKRKLSCRAPGRSIHTHSRRALLLGLAFDLYRPEPSPSQQSQTKDVKKAMRLSKGYVVVLLDLLLLAGGVSAAAQVAPSATGAARLPITVGGVGSVFQPDYAGGGVAQAGPDALFGVGAYLDVRFTRWVQLEAEARWLAFNAYRGFTEENYLIGPRIPLYHFGRSTPYAKVLFGVGNGDFLTGASSAIAFGGGLDYRLNKRLTLRLVDFEYQRWSSSPKLFPYGGSSGIGFNF